MRRHMYPAIIHKDPNTDFGVSFPDFPGCVGAGATIADAVADAEDALALHLSGMISDGESAPAATAAEDVLKEADPEGLVAIAMVPASLPTRSRRYNVMLPEDLVERIDAISGNRSAFIVEAIRAALTDRALP